jgi:hypothetical protein
MDLVELDIRVFKLEKRLKNSLAYCETFAKLRICRIFLIFSNKNFLSGLVSKSALCSLVGT